MVWYQGSGFPFIGSQWFVKGADIHEINLDILQVAAI
jgi:hypothetical protein